MENQKPRKGIVIVTTEIEGVVSKYEVQIVNVHKNEVIEFTYHSSTDGGPVMRPSKAPNW